jgi:predicted NBD/HSP70 family sugar kinase
MLGASPSTITSMVHNLMRRGLITETGAAESRGGRPPMILDLAPAVGGGLAVAVGALTVRVAASDLRGGIVSHDVVPTPRTPRTFRKAVLAALERASESLSGPVRAVAVAVPGAVTPGHEEIALTSDIPAWPKEHPRDWLAAFDVPVVVENDANLSALGEQVSGLLADDHSVLFVAVGASVGAGLLVGGEVFRGSNGAAGNIGAIRLGVGASALQSELSAAGIVRRYHESGGDDSVESSEVVAQLAEEGDVPATETIAETIELLALGIANAVAVLDPTIVVLGGGVITAVQSLLAPIRQRLGELLPAVPDIVLSRLGSDASLTGAAWLAAQRARSDILAELDAHPMPA